MTTMLLEKQTKYTIDAYSESPNLRPGSPSARRHQASETTHLLRGPLPSDPLFI